MLIVIRTQESCNNTCKMVMKDCKTRWPECQNAFDETESTAHSMAIIVAVPGSGKNDLFMKNIEAYPQSHFHPTLNCHQIVYLKIDCSHDGSFQRNFVSIFFRAIDKIIGSNYEKKLWDEKRHGVETMLALMACKIANMFALGLLVIDEIQHLESSKVWQFREKMLNFFVTMTNTIGIPVLFVGYT